MPFTSSGKSLEPVTVANQATAQLERPAAIWTAFARQSLWKSWVIVLLFALLLVQGVVLVAAVNRDPDVVLVAESGKSTYVNRSLTNDALALFLAEQRQQPSDVTVLHFSKTFLLTMLGANSSTIEAAWPEALGMMDGALRSRMAKEAVTQKLVETIKAAQVRTLVEFEELVLLERFGNVLHVRATVKRQKSQLVDGASQISDRIQVELVERVVPRTPARPDGLEIAEYRNKVL